MAWLLYGSRSTKSNILCINTQNQAGIALSRFLLTRAVLGKSVAELSALQNALPSLSTEEDMATGTAWLNKCSVSTLMGTKPNKRNKPGQPELHQGCICCWCDTASQSGFQTHGTFLKRHILYWCSEG